MDIVLGGVDRQRVHHFQARRNDASANDRRHGVAGTANVVERGEQHALRERVGQQFHHHFGDDTEHPFRSHHRCHQVVSGRVECLAAENQLVTFESLHREAENVLQRQAVLQTVHAA